MGNNYLLRASKWAESKAKDVTNSVKPSDIKKNSRKKRDRSAQLGNALLINPLEKAAETASEGPPVARACPSEANADFNSSTQDNQPPTTMKPIGEYPSLAEYKSVGLKPPPRHVMAQGKLSSRADEDGDDLMTDTPITPVADEIMDGQITYVDQQNDTFTDGQDSGSFTTSMEGVVGKETGLEVNAQVNDNADGPDKTNPNTNLPSPISSSFPPPLLAPSPLPARSPVLAPSSTHTSPSPFHTPAGTPVDEVADPIMAPSKRTKKKTAALAAGNLLQHPQPKSAPAEPTAEPPAEPAAEPAVGSTPERVTPDLDLDERPGRNYASILKYIPQPASTKFDTATIRNWMESAISRSKSDDEDAVAVSLLYFWSHLRNLDPASVDFKLGLLHNILHGSGKGTQEALALGSLLRNQRVHAERWYNRFIESHARAGLLEKADDEAEEATATFNPDEPRLKVHFKNLKDYYRDTSGSKLEEAFVTGKTNTAPIKRPKKPCPANEEAFRRRVEWEADKDHEETVRTKRARLRRDQPDDSIPASVSDLRPHRQEVEIPQPDIHTDPDVIMSLDQDGPKQDVPNQDVPELQSRRQERATRKSALKATSTKDRPKLQPKGKGKKNDVPLSNAKIEANKRHNLERFEAAPHIRSSSPPRNVNMWPAMDDDSDSELSNSIYSKRTNDWNTAWSGSRHAPNDMSRGLDNVDDCSVCDKPGNLICCETCLNAFHRKCMNKVDLNGVDNDEWFCPDCDTRHVFTTAIITARGGNKTEFFPAEEYRTCFKGVEHQISYKDTAGPKWSLSTRAYREVPDIPRLTKPPRKNGAEVEYLDYNDENLLKLTDNGHVVLCSGCSRSSDNSRPIIKCDYCPRRYHLDCLDPPLAHPPNPKKGWMCPDHKNPNEDVLYKEDQSGSLMERRRREPKKPTTESTDWEDGWTGADDEAPGDAITWDFISAVKEQHHVRQEEVIRSHYMNVANSAVEDLARQLSRAGVQIPDGWMENFRSSLESGPRRARSGQVQGNEAEAADALVSLSGRG